MAERGAYRSIATALISGKDFRKLPERARWIFVVLKMNAGMAGIETWYPEEIAPRIANESGATVRQVLQAFDTLERTGWIQREDNVFWLCDHLKFDPHALVNNSKHRTAVQRHIAGMPRLSIIRSYIEHYKDWFPTKEAAQNGVKLDNYPEKIPVSNRESDRVSNTLSNRVSNQNEGLNSPNDSLIDKGIDTGTEAHKQLQRQLQLQEQLQTTSPDSGESVAKANGHDPPPLSKAEFDELYQAWLKLGRVLDPGRFRKLVNPIFPKTGERLYTIEQLTNGMAAFDEHVRTLPASKARFETFDVFIANVGYWVELGAMPAVNERGELTDRGRSGLADML